METAEALYLTQGFTYDSAEGADRRFSGEDPGFVYSRFNNPTVKMFEDRLALLEGAEVCRAQATGMASIHGPDGPGPRGRPRGGRPRPVRLVPLARSPNGCRASASRRPSSTPPIPRPGRRRSAPTPRPC
jgi:hypothetical protein